MSSRPWASPSPEWQLGITRTALSRILNGHAGISPDMVRRIEVWLGMQMDCDLWLAARKPALKVERAPEAMAAA